MLEFSKIHGAGNDFIIIDDSEQKWIRNATFIKKICDRHRGIGADGIIFLISTPEKSNTDFRMEFYNNDGYSVSMCGNGLRCVALFASKYLTDKRKFNIETEAGILSVNLLQEGEIQIQIPIIQFPEKLMIDSNAVFFSNTGVPHLVIIADEDVHNLNITELGKYWRNHKEFSPDGVNVNFISNKFKIEKEIKIRTFERGVEAETCACGTGIAATALTLNTFFNLKPPFLFRTVDNDILTVDFYENCNTLLNDRKILLTGPAVEIFHGVLDKKYFAAFAEGDK
jgi:diaminopimelate epimerase